ncbi:DMT family transporter [Desulfovibrio sp. TomC]|uniref:DMT family transporter n=1 Tax=Desulfovibrio sp. TomC TaxID=1562888 RepID=UPI000573B24B|nr:DMT family transporter [Desulfovibrio sp. TomC]KHK01979.1 Permeases of the drug/metabolite transporter (DMT) superfamily [Desulfovibrio sp. TomC]
MNWFFLSLVTATTQAVKDTFLKSAMGRTDPTLAMLLYSSVAAAFLWVFAIGSPEVVFAPAFWPLLLIGGAFGGITFWLYGLALNRGDLSLALPMLAFTPLFLLITSPLTLDEFPRPGGLVGIALVAVGAYVLNLRERRHGIFGPIKALVTNTGTRLMLLVAVVWSIGANLDKLGLQASSPAVWAASIYTASALALIPFAARRLRRSVGELPGFPFAIATAGLLEGIGLFCQMHALPLTQVSYVIAVKRLSIILGVLLGAVVFHEQDLAHRLPGAAVMVVGVFFIAVFG